MLVQSEEPLDNSNNNQPPEKEKVTIWGTQITSDSVYLDDETLAIKQADHISDLLRSIPGVDVGGAHSLNQRITIRSMDDKDLRITIDGANQNTYMYHHMGNLQIHADILKSVDVEVGKNSVINGGLGGSVKFETKEAKELLVNGNQFGGRIQASYNDNSSTGFAISAYGQLTEQLDILAYYNDISRDNYSVGGGKILNPQNQVIDGTDGKVRGLKGNLEDLLLKFGFDVNDNQRFSLGYETYNDEGNYSYRPDMGLATDLAIADSLNIPLTYPTQFSRDTLTLNYDLDLDNTLLKFTLFENQSTLWRDERGLESWYPPYAVINEGEATNIGFNLLGSTNLSGSTKQVLTYGVDIIDYETHYIVDNIELAGEDARHSAIYLEDRINVNNELTIIPGIRYDHYQINSSVIDDSFTDFTYGLNIEYQATKAVLLSASSTQLFKGPEIGEVFVGAGLGETPNPAIEAESGTNNEFTIAYQAKTLGADNFRTGITFFRTNIDNYIYDYANIPTTPPCSLAQRCAHWKDNVGDMKIDGVEAYLGYLLGNLNLLLTYSNSDSELSAFSEYSHQDTANYLSLDGARIDRVQGDTVSFSLDYDLEQTDLSLHWDFMIVDDVAAAPDLDGATLTNEKKGFSIHNVSARWLPQEVNGLSITLGVDNLFDEFYASQSSRTGVSFHPRFGQLYLLDYEPGRNIKMTLSYEF